MPFTHYPKLEENLFLSACWYGPDDPRNTMKDPLREYVVLHGVAQNFTRFYGTVFADVPLDLTFSFSNEERVVVPQPRQADNVALAKFHADAPRLDERLPKDVREFYLVDERGTREVTDEDLADLNYDGIALVSKYEPAAAGKPAVGDKFLVTIYGRFLRVRIDNRGTVAAKNMRVFVRASVF